MECWQCAKSYIVKVNEILALSEDDYLAKMICIVTIESFAVHP